MSWSSPNISLTNPDRIAVGAVQLFLRCFPASGAGKLIGRRTRLVARLPVLASDDTGIDQLPQFVVGVSELRQ
jgi:hypothetical protein